MQAEHLMHRRHGRARRWRPLAYSIGRNQNWGDCDVHSQGNQAWARKNGSLLLRGGERGALRLIMFRIGALAVSASPAIPLGVSDSSRKARPTLPKLRKQRIDEQLVGAGVAGIALRKTFVLRTMADSNARDGIGRTLNSR